MRKDRRDACADIVAADDCGLSHRDAFHVGNRVERTASENANFQTEVRSPRPGVGPCVLSRKEYGQEERGKASLAHDRGTGYPQGEWGDRVKLRPNANGKT